MTHAVVLHIAVDASYDGPRINEETKKVDLPFVKSLVQHFKDQKKIHKKYAFMVIITLARRSRSSGGVLLNKQA